jgi:hypothetical protein
MNIINKIVSSVAVIGLIATASANAQNGTVAINFHAPNDQQCLCMVDQNSKPVAGTGQGGETLYYSVLDTMGYKYGSTNKFTFLYLKNVTGSTCRNDFASVCKLTKEAKTVGSLTLTIGSDGKTANVDSQSENSGFVVKPASASNTPKVVVDYTPPSH